MKRLFLLAATAALLATGQLMAFETVTYTEDFDDGNAATRFTAPVVDAETGVFDGDVDYAFDYGAIGVPAAPSGGGSTGVLMQVNLSDAGPVDEGEGVAIYPLAGASLPPDFVVSMDVFFNAEFQSSGSTEYGLFSIHTSGANDPADQSLTDDVAFPIFGLGEGDGLTWAMTGDAGTSSSDYALIRDPGNADAGTAQTFGSFDDLPAGKFPNLSTGVGATGPDGNWNTIELTKAGNFYTFRIDGILLASFTDTANEFDGGSIAIGYADVFNSVGTPDLPVGPDPNPLDNIPFGDEFPNLAHFIIYDNLQITAIPEPATGVVAAVSMIGLAFRRRR
ncbi:MAG: PEP-CTERM sorting domain-containing protein [Planctomycetota bacterium]